MINITNFGDFLNCTVLEYLLKYVSSISLYSEMLEPYSSNLKTRLASECTVYKNLIQNHVNKLKYSWLLLVHEYLNSVGPSCTILSVLAKFAVVCGYSTSCVENAFSARNRVDTVSI